MVQGERKAHVAVMGLHVEMREQRGQVRVIELVVDNEAGVDGKWGAIVVDVYGRGMPAGSFLCLIQCHVMDVADSPGGGRAGNSRTNNSNFETPGFFCHGLGR